MVFHGYQWFSMIISGYPWLSMVTRVHDQFLWINIGEGGERSCEESCRSVQHVWSFPGNNKLSIDSEQQQKKREVTNDLSLTFREVRCPRSRYYVSTSASP